MGKVGKCKGWGGNPLYQGLLSVPGGFLALPFPHSPPWAAQPFSMAFGVNHLSLAEVQNRPQLGRPGRSSRLQKVGHGGGVGRLSAWQEFVIQRFTLRLRIRVLCLLLGFPEVPNWKTLQIYPQQHQLPQLVLISPLAEQPT